MSFVGLVTIPENRSEDCLWLIFRKDELLVNLRGDDLQLPRGKDLSDIGLQALRIQYLGLLDGRDCYSAEVAEDAIEPEGTGFRHLRLLLGAFDDELFGLAGRAFQIVNWDRNHQYCGRCGSPAVSKSDERAKICSKCGLVSYPRISPAVIVAVVKDRRILLAHSGRFRSNMYSVLAGFVEAGETFEECVHREIKEEVNIEVKNIKYFGSQPWPFPNSIMVGFTAEYASGEIRVDGEEITDAAWFSAEEIPFIPGKWSIARKLIDWFVESDRQ